MDIATLNKYVADKRLKVQAHPSEDLLIWNYTEVTQFKKLWDDITLACRGLITDNAGNIVARSFNKFFNENERPYEATPDFKVYAKLDGSLGILFYYRDKWILASRGSFVSAQAQNGMQILQQRYGAQLLDGLDRNLSYSFEIIYPENRIVVNYGDERKLVLLAAFKKKNGNELSLDDPALQLHLKKFGIETVREYDPAAIFDLKQRNTTNEEGYVVRFTNGTRIKIKFATYIELHKLAGNVNEIMLLQEYAAGRAFAEVCEKLPDEFHDWAGKVYRNIDTCFQNLVSETGRLYKEALEGTATRAEFARNVLSSPYKAVLFLLYEGRDTRNALLRFIDPAKMSPQDEVAAPGGVPGSGMRSRLATGFNPTLIILYGISGSGKSFFAKRWLDTHRDAIVVNRDELARILAPLSGPRENERQKLITALSRELIRNALLRGATVLADGNYLALDHVKGLLLAVPSGCSVQVRIFETPALECMTRLLSEKGHAGVDMALIQQQEALFLANYKQVTAFVADEVSKRAPIVQNPELPPCYVFDIDGTLAIRGDRGPYDESKVHLDIAHPDVVALAKTLRGYSGVTGHVIHICTGRTEACREATEKWLHDVGISYYTLQMRAVEDKRPDYMVKEDMWRSIVEVNYISMMYDDRSQVVSQARALGFTVAQVQYGEF